MADDSVSRRHARVDLAESGYKVADLRSTNGTYVNETITHGAQLLRDGDYLRVGNCIYRFLSGGNLELEYHGGTKIYVPSSKIELVQKYVGGKGGAVSLAHIGGAAWVRQKEAAQKAVTDLAADMIELQAARDSRPGIAFPDDTEWQREFDAAIVDPLGKDPAAEMASLRPKGVRAIRIQPQYSKQPPARWLEPAGYLAMFAESARSGTILSCLIDPNGLPEVDRLCRKYPNAPVIIDHLCRIGVNGKVDPADVQALCSMAQHPKVLVKVGAFYALGKKTPPYTDLAPLVRQVVQAFGARRCLWESDCPFQVVDHQYKDSLALVRDHIPELSADDRQWLLARTAEQWLFTK